MNAFDVGGHGSVSNTVFLVKHLLKRQGIFQKEMNGHPTNLNIMSTLQ